MADEEIPVVLDTSRIYEIEERSDFDRHQNVKAKDLGEDWGDGFFVQEEPVLVTRDKRTGAILRTEPLSSVPWINMDPDDDVEPVVADPVHTPRQRTASEREKLVEILAMRLFRWYADRPPSVTEYNPIYDGIPEAPAGSRDLLQPLPGTKLYPATPGEVLEWLKMKVIAPRVQIVNKKRGWKGYQADLGADEFSVRIQRDPIR